MIRSIGAVAAGYILMVCLVVGFFRLMGLVQPIYFGIDHTLAMPLTWQLLVLAFDILAAALGGAITAWCAQYTPFRHAYWLSGIILIMGLISIPAAHLRGDSLWLGITTGFLGSLACLAGGWTMDNKLR
jgi:hypothetical protein